MPVVPFCRNPTGVVPSGKSAAHSGPSPPTRGTLRDRYETWAGDAMAVSDRSARDRADERLRCGRESTWSRHPDADAKSAAMIRAGDGGQKAGAPRRARHKRENHRAGKAGSHRLSPWFLPPAFFSAGGPQVSVGTWPSLRPRISEGCENLAKLGRAGRREDDDGCRVGFDVVSYSQRAKSKGQSRCS